MNKNIKFWAFAVLLILLLTSCDDFYFYTYTFDNRSSYTIYIMDSRLEPKSFEIAPKTIKTAESNSESFTISNYQSGSYVSASKDGRKFIFTDNPEGYIKYW